ncbi:uncharacterized protein LOC131677212 [Topomyia yanbarensis]|uniref:uncharacterized protein LOC131677212 n=1 Tax=Topomyia yanbarensis TaxID=2498891 RepID=UPI00273B57B0|nr:uncharacterized protein LOC131677212 [Topomyia yanbarensis]
MKLLIYFLILTSSTASVYSACNLGNGAREQGDQELYVLHAKKGPVEEPVNMTLTFSFEVNPVMNEELTYFHIYGSLTSCVFTFDNKQDPKKGFWMLLSSMEPVTELSGYATVYGFRR